MLDEVEREPAQVVPVVDEPLDDRQQSGEVLGADQIDGLDHPLRGRRSERLGHRLGGDLATGEGEHLLQDAERVPHGTVARPDHRLQRAVVDGVALGVTQ